MTAPGVPPTADPGDKARIGQVAALRRARDGAAVRPLAQAVQENIEHLWRLGGRRDETEPGRQPEWIRVRRGFTVRRKDDVEGPVLPRLIKSKGLQLRLQLLLLFDAQCRYAPGDLVRNVRRVTPHVNDEFQPWRQLVLTESESQGGYRSPADLRARQITEAMRVLEDERLLSIPREPGGVRRRYNPGKDGKSWHMLSEESTAETHPRYEVPEHGIRIHRQFFTNLWVFALTDTELAAYLALSTLRTLFPAKHAAQGVFLREANRREELRLTRSAWRATDLLHRFRLVDRARDPGRHFRTGNIGDFATRWANKEVLPAHFTLNDTALQRPALDTIHQVLTAPHPDDIARREHGQEFVDEQRRMALASNSLFTSA